MAYGVDASMHAMESPGGYAAARRPRRESELAQLGKSDDAMLPRGELRNHCVPVALGGLRSVFRRNPPNAIHGPDGSGPAASRPHRSVERGA
jgi:hypothetical protein